MPEPHSWLHAATATAEGGHVRTDDGELSTALASPLAPHCTGLTPEQLLAAAFASCLHHAAVEAAGEITDEAHTVQVRAEARLGRDDDGRYRADVHASISSTGLTPGQLTELVEHADRLWPFSSGDSTRHRLTVTRAQNGGR
ncbi:MULTISPECIES: OsmC family protein [Micromonospora]|uniref:Osmotically inducible protein OsmC n=1 Tax=Micromonospora rosaria TaxID=47874 RepID=A0A136PU85_9ACTN|nr:OsmC family protein [Micromonospora rosaria]KXK61982.1 osmotically inducible protein OsmC [Micromonospora rosaria]